LEEKVTNDSDENLSDFLNKYYFVDYEYDMQCNANRLRIYNVTN